jgi:hypothetical protein
MKGNIFKIIFSSLLFVIFLLDPATPKDNLSSLENEQCNFLPKNYINELNNLKSIKSIDLTILDKRKWMKNSMSIISDKQFNYIRDRNKKFFDSVVNVHYPFGSCLFKANVRQSGDLKDHIKLKSGQIQQSLEVKILNGNIGGIVSFKLFLPETRSNDDEIIMTKIFHELGILAPRTRYMKVSVNDQEISYIFQEKIAKEMLESFKRREGPMFEGDETLLWSNSANYKWQEDISLARIDNGKLLKKSNEHLLLGLETYSIIQNVYLDYINNSYSKSLKKEGVFLNFSMLSKSSVNLKKIWIMYESIMIAANGAHGLRPHNRKFFWNSLEFGFEPIYYDGTVNLNSIWNKHEQEFNSSDNFNELDFLKYSQYISEIEIEEVIQNIKKIDKLNFYNTVLESGLEISKEQINRKFQNLLVGLSIFKKIIVKSKLSYNDKSNTIKINFDKDFIQKILSLHPDAEIYYVKNIIQNKKVILTEMCSLDKCSEKYISFLEAISIMQNHKNKKTKKISYIVPISEDRKFQTQEYNLNGQILKIKKSIGVSVKIDNDKNTIRFEQTRSSDWVMLHDSYIDNINIVFIGKNDKDSKKEGLNSFNITNCFTIYNSHFKSTKLKASNAFCEDAINIVNSNGLIEEMHISNTTADAFDGDFSNLTIKNIFTENAGNDCLDVSSGNYVIQKAILHNCKDKGVSVGEYSSADLSNFFINKSEIGVASKDSSTTYINNINISDTKSCLAAYKKKQENWGGNIAVKNFNCINSKKDIDIDKYSKIYFQ